MGGVVWGEEGHTGVGGMVWVMLGWVGSYRDGVGWVM